MSTSPLGERVYSKRTAFTLTCACGTSIVLPAATYDEGRRRAREAGWSLPRHGAACPACKGLPPSWGGR